MSLKNLLLELLFPSFCVHCHKLGPHICESCYQLINFTWQRDFKANLEKNLNQVYLDKLQIMAEFKKPLSSLIKQVKYQHNQEGGRFLAQMLYFHLAIDLKQIDLITYIPLHYKKLQARGYNQCQVIAKEFSYWTKIPVKKLLIRHKNNQTQASISDPIKRQENTSGIFKLDEKHKALLGEKDILLIDDVVTTGSTLNEAAKVLKEANVKQVTTIALASRMH